MIYLLIYIFGVIIVDIIGILVKIPVKYALLSAFLWPIIIPFGVYEQIKLRLALRKLNKITEKPPVDNSTIDQDNNN